MNFCQNLQLALAHFVLSSHRGYKKYILATEFTEDTEIITISTGRDFRSAPIPVFTRTGLRKIAYVDYPGKLCDPRLLEDKLARFVRRSHRGY